MYWFKTVKQCTILRHSTRVLGVCMNGLHRIKSIVLPLHKAIAMRTKHEPPLGFAFATSRSCKVTSCTTSLRLCTSPYEDKRVAYTARSSIPCCFRCTRLYLRQGYILFSFQVVLCRVPTVVLHNTFLWVLAWILAPKTMKKNSWKSKITLDSHLLTYASDLPTRLTAPLFDSM